MKTGKHIKFFALLLAVLLLISSFPLTALAAEANDSVIEMVEGDVITDFAAADSTATSSDPSIAWVDENGALNAMKPGTVTVSDGQQDYTVTVSDFEDGTPVVGNLKLLARFNDSMQFYDGHVYLLFTSYQDGVTINVPDLYAGYEIEDFYYHNIREDISYGSNHTGNDADSVFTFNKDMKSVTLNRGEIVTIGMYRDFDLSVPQAALGSIKNSSLWAGLTAAGKATVVENLFKLLDNGSISADQAFNRFKEVLDETGLDYNKLLDGVVDGGVCFNRELYNQKLEYDQYENVTYEMDITEKQLGTMTAYLGGNNGKFSILKNSCATVALRAWNAAVGTKDGEPNAYYLTSTGNGILSIIDAPKGVRDSIKNRLPGYYLNNAEGVAEPDAGFEDETGWVYVSAPEKVAPVTYTYADKAVQVDEDLTALTPLVTSAKAGKGIYYNKDEQEIGVDVQADSSEITGINFIINGQTVTLDGSNMPEKGIWFKTAVKDAEEGVNYYVTDADGKTLASYYNDGEVTFRADTLPQSYRIVSGKEGSKNILRVNNNIPEGVQITAEVYYKEDGQKIAVDKVAELQSGTKIYVKPDISSLEISHMIESIDIDGMNIYEEENFDAEEGAYCGLMPDNYAELNISTVEAEIEPAKDGMIQIFVGDTLNVEEYTHLYTDGDKEGYVLDETEWEIIHDENGALEGEGSELKAVKEGSAVLWARAKKNPNIGAAFMIDVLGNRSDYAAVTFNGETGENYVLHNVTEENNTVIPYSGYLVKKDTEVNIYPRNNGSKAVFAVLCNGEALSVNEEFEGPCIASVTADTDLDIAVTFAEAQIKGLPKDIKFESKDDTYQLEARTVYNGLLGIVGAWDDRIRYTASNDLISVDKNGLITVTDEIPEDGAAVIVTAYVPSTPELSATTKVVLGDYKGDKIVGRLTISSRPITKAQLIAHGAVTFTPYEDMELPVSYYRYYKPNEKYDALLKDYAENPENYTSDPALYNDNELGLEDRESYFDVIEGGIGIEPQIISLKSGESITMSNYGYDDGRIESILSVLENSDISSDEQAQILIEQLRSYIEDGTVDENATFDSLADVLKTIITTSRKTGENPANGRSEGGLDINREMYNQFIRPDSQLPNNYYSVDITADELEMMKAYIADPDNNYFSLMDKNCATGSVDIWNATLADKPELKLTGNYTGIAVEPESLYIELGLLARKQNLDGESGKDFYPRSVAHPMSYAELIEAIDKLGEPELTDAYKAQLDELLAAYHDLNGTEQSMVTNSDKLFDSIQAYEDMLHEKDLEAFDKYVADKLAYVDSLAQDGDSEVSKLLISAAKTAITAIPYDTEKSLEENKADIAKLVAILEQVLDDRRYQEHPMLGDVDVDRDVTAADVTFIQRNAAWMLTPLSCNFAAADTDEDGTMSVMDATMLQYWLADMPANENIGKPIK